MSVFEYEDARFESQEQEQFGESQESFESQEMHEGLEMELTHQLLEVASEEELEEFLGKLVRSVARGARSFVRSGVGRAIGGVLRNVAKTALPMVGSALGSFVAPGLGTAIGGKLGSMASSLLEAEERESMGEEEAEFEVARRYVRWATGTVRNGMRAPRGMDPRVVARSAAVSAARRYAPTLLRSGPRSAPAQPWRGRRRGGSGRWGSYGSAAWSPRRHGTCACGRSLDDSGDSGDSGVDAGLDNDQDGQETHESFEAMEAYENQEFPQSGPSPAGRWYRRGNRVVIVGV
jgi:hypothetical protein